MPNMQVMDPNIIISEINDYSAKTGLKVTTICQRAFGNARYLDRLHGRLDRLGEEVQRFREFTADNPPPQREGDAA